VSNDKVIALTATGERPAATFSGYVMLIGLLLVILGEIYGIGRLSQGPDALGLAIVAITTVLFILILPGFYMLQPNQAVAITLFGE